MDSGKKKIQLGIWIAVVVAGVVVAPGYYFYCKFFSGKQVGKFQLSERVATLNIPGGPTLKFGVSGALKPFSVDLDPTMNPVEFNWRGRVGGVIGIVPNTMDPKWTNSYRATLRFGDRVVMQQPFSVSISKDEEKNKNNKKVEETRYIPIGSTAVGTAGKYYFVLEESARPQLDVSDVSVEVRRNVLDPSIKVIVAGAGLILIGGFMMLRVLSTLDDGKSEQTGAAAAGK